MRTLTELGVIVIENEEGFELDMSSVKDDFNETKAIEIHVGLVNYVLATEKDQDKQTNLIANIIHSTSQQMEMLAMESMFDGLGESIAELGEFLGLDTEKCEECEEEECPSHPANLKEETA